MLLKRYDIGVIIRRAVKKYAVLFIGSGLEFSMGDIACEAVTDEKWLGFVMEQLLANALKYTKEGCIRIYGADSAGNPCGDRAVEYIAVEDTGIGIRAVQRKDGPEVHGNRTLSMPEHYGQTGSYGKRGIGGREGDEGDSGVWAGEGIKYGNLTKR